MALLADGNGASQMARFAIYSIFVIAWIAMIGPDNAHARAGYAKWVKHGDRYSVSGNFGSFQRTFGVHVTWKGNGFVIHTPLGVYRLKRRGNSVAFKVYIDKAWAHVTWSRTRAFVRYKGQKGAARVMKVGSGARRKGRRAPRRKQNFNLRR